MELRNRVEQDTMWLTLPNRTSDSVSAKMEVEAEYQSQQFGGVNVQNMTTSQTPKPRQNAAGEEEEKQ